LTPHLSFRGNSFQFVPRLRREAGRQVRACGRGDKVVQLYKRKGGEILVNTETSGNQTGQHIETLTSGGFVMVWTDSSGLGTDTSGSGVKAQLFDGDGAKIGGEFLVNTSVANAQQFPRVSSLNSGRFVVTWTDSSGQGGDTNGFAIKGQLFEANGSKVGSEFLVNTATLSDQSISKITELQGGGFVISWQDMSGQGGDASGAGIKAQIFNAAAVPVGGEFLVNTFTSGSQLAVELAALPSGGFAACWLSPNGLRLQLFDGTGGKIGSEVQANSGSPSFGGGRIVALDTGFVVVWSEKPTSTSPFGFDVKGQLFDAAGQKVGGAFEVNGQQPGDQRSSDVQALPGGGFMVAWQNASATGNLDEFRAQIFDSSGAKVGVDFVVSTAAASGQTSPKLTVLSSGDVVATWTDGSGAGGDASGLSVKAQILTLSADAPTDIGLSASIVSETAVDNIPVATLSSTGALNSSFSYAILSDTSGGAFRVEGDKLVITDNSLLDFESRSTVELTVRTTDLNGHSYDETLTLNIADTVHEARYAAGNEMPLTHASGGNLFTESRTAFLEGGNYLVTWANLGVPTSPPTPGYRGQLFDADGTPIGGEFAVDTVARTGFTVAPLQGGGFMAVYEGNSVPRPGGGNYFPINAQIFDANGSKVGGEIIVNTATGGTFSDPDAARLSNGHVVVIWHQDGEQVAQIFDGNGDKLGGAFQIAASPNFEPHVAALAGGGFIATWPADNGLNAQLFDQGGVRIGSAFTIQSDLPNSEDGRIAALANGGFVVAIGGEDGTNHQIEAHLFDATGHQVADILVLAPQPVATIGISTPSVAGLPGGGFVIGWSATTGASELGVLSVQAYNALGQPMGDVIHPEADPAKSATSPFIATTLDGDIALSWTHFFRDSAGTPNSDIETRFFTFKSADDPFGGTANNDSLSTDEATALAGNVKSNDVNPGSVASVNGVAGNVGHQISLASGAYLTLNADGTFSYDPNHAFDTLAGPGSGAANMSAQDSFTYTLTSGSTATVTVTIAGLDSDDVLIGTAGNDALSGGIGRDVLAGLGGDDVLSGGPVTANEMIGGTGDDIYYVDAPGDSVTENAGEGNDRVLVSVSYALAAGQEIEVLAGPNAAATSALVLTGNNLGQFISGNAGANTLIGGGGSDYLLGLGGDDILVGNADAASTLQGGTGDDWYYVYRTGDSIIEFAGEGSDRILTAVNYTLSAGQEIETLTAIDPTATNAIDLTGNALAQNIFGNAGANTLTGGGGADYLLGLGGDDILIGNADAASTLQGGTGNDWYYVSRTGDSIVEFAGEGNDRIVTTVSYTLSAGQEIETLSAADQSGTAALDLAGNDYGQLIFGTNGGNTMSGNGGADQLAGFGGDDILLGGDGDDLLNGGAGHDVLNGGAGADLFVFADALGGSNVDAIQDFASGVDRIVLDHSVFTGLATGTLAASAFVLGTGAGDADDRIIYNQATGELWFDADGNGAGAPVLFATLAPSTTLVASDFAVV
jgi:VCBS repeat-containing protein